MGCCLQQGWGLWPGSARRDCGDTGSVGGGGVWAAFRVGTGAPAPAYVWKVCGRVGAAAKLRLSSSGHGLTAGGETWPDSPSCWEPFPPHPSGTADAAGPFLALSSSGAGSRTRAHVLQTGAQPLPGHSSASLAATWTNTGHKPLLDFCGFFFLLTTPSQHCELGFVFLEGVVWSEPLIKAV